MSTPPQSEQQRSLEHFIEHQVNVQVSQRLAALTPSVPAPAAPRPNARPLQPKPFLGDSTQDARVWLSTFRNYLLLTHTPDAETVPLAASYLQGAAEIWWQSLRSSAPQSWSVFEPAFIDHFSPLGGEVEARQALLLFVTKPRGRMTVKEYIHQFTALQLRIPDQAEAEKMSLFMIGLPQAVRKQAGLDGSETLDVAKRKVQMAEDADRVYGTGSIAAPPRATFGSTSATVPMDLGMFDDESDGSTSDGRDRIAQLERQIDVLALNALFHRPSFGRGGGRGRFGRGNERSTNRTDASRPRLTEQERKELMENDGCFFCRVKHAGHRAYNCPKKLSKNQ
jgi:hypothetical protein